MLAEIDLRTNEAVRKGRRLLTCRNDVPAVLWVHWARPDAERLNSMAHPLLAKVE